MPREGTKTIGAFLNHTTHVIEIRYASGVDENLRRVNIICHVTSIEIRYAPGGDENINSSESFWYFEIRNAT